MKPTYQNPFLRNFLAAASLGLCLGQTAIAASIYWDTNGNGTGSGAATGTWGSSTFWTATEAGNVATTGTLPTADDDVFIAAGTTGTTGTITINGAQVVGSITVQEPAASPGVTISGGTSLTLGGGSSASKGLFVSGNGAHTVSTPLILNGANTIQNAGNLTLAVSGGITGTGDLTLRNNNTGATGINLSTAAVNNTGAISNAGTSTGFVILGNANAAPGTGSGGLGANVTSFSQDSSAAPFEFRNANNSSYAGNYNINAGTLHWGGTNTTGTITATNATSTINLGATSGSSNATLNVINNAVSGKLNNNIVVRAGSTGTKTIGVALTGSSVTFSTTGSITLDDNVNLQPNTTSTLNPNGLIQDGSNGAKGITKVGPGTVNLNLAHTYSGATSVNAGSLILTGASGSLPNTSGITVNGGTFQLNNTGAANSGNRIPDSTVVTMAGGTLDFKNDAAAATAFSETVDLTASAAGTVTASQAAADGSSTLTLDSFTRNIGTTLAFTGTGLGVDARNRILFNTPPTTLGGIIPWATYGTTGFASYDGTNGVVAATSTDIDAQGSTIADDSNSNLRIFGDGSGAAIALAATTTSINSLVQANTVVAPPTIDTAGKTLRVNSVLLSSAANTKGLTIGSAANDGTLAAGTAGGELLLVNNSASVLTLNAAIADNTSASSVTKAGAGDATFAGNSTYTGPTYLGGGVVTAADDNAFGTGTININSPTRRLAVANGVTISNPIVFNGGGEGNRGLLENSAAGGNATLAGPITLIGNLAGGGHFASNGTGGTLTISGPITATTTNPVVRLGTIILSGDGNDSSYTTFNASAGVTRLGASDALLPSATLDMGTSGESRFDLNGFNQTLAGINRTPNNNTFIGNSSTTGDSTLTTTGTSTYSGSILNVLSPGTMKTFLVVDSGSLTLPGSFSAETATINNTGNLILSAGGGDTFAPAGRLITVNNGGTLTFTGVNRVQNDTVIDVKSGGTFDPNGQTDTIGYLKGAGSVVNLNTGLTLNMPLVGSGSDFSGTISGTGGITIAGLGTGGADTNMQVLSGANSFTGGVNVQRGILRITNSDALGAAPVAGTKTITIAASSNKFLELDGAAGDITLPSSFLFSTSGVNGTIRNIAGNNTIEGAFSLTSGNGNTKIVSDAGSLTLNGNITTVGSAGANRVLDLDGTSTAANAVNGVIANGGGFLTAVTKSGTGRWILGGASTYTNPTTVNGGTLHLTGSIAAGSAVTVGGATASGTPTLTGAGGTVNGTLNIAAAGGGAAGTINPGTVGTTGTLNAGATTIGGTYACDVNGAATDLLVVTGDLTLGGTLSVNEIAAGTPGTYVIATYTGTRSGTLGGTLPAGYSVNYDDSNKEVELVIAPAGGFASWITGTFANGTVPGGQQGTNDDPDNDGATNLVEFAFDGDPTTGANNGRIHAFTVDTDQDGETADSELVLTIAVRSAVGTFTGATSKSASGDGITYTIEGSTTLSSFPTQVNVVPTAVLPSPATLSPGYAWKSFNLEGSNSLPGKGFLRASVTTP